MKRISSVPLSWFAILLAAGISLEVSVSGQVVREATFPTVPGKTFLARFRIVPQPGQTHVSPFRVEITGDTLRRGADLLTALPATAADVPYFLPFTADSSTTMLRFSMVSGDVADASQIAGLEVAEPLVPVQADGPNVRQQAQIERRYGLFLHFGINTFNNLEWSDGTKPASSYHPTSLDVEQWVQTACEAGMTYVLIISKHHDGFCMWDSPWTSYDVGSSPVPDDILAAAAAACRKFGIGMAIYYSLWDRHEATYPDDASYNQYALRQLEELLGKYGPVCELWLDGGWDKANTRWPSAEVYDLARRLQPDCQVSTNWTIGSPSNPDAKVLPAEQQPGDPIRYFPSDFRLGDPMLPKFPDPKVFSHENQRYYLPFEATVTLSAANNWFYHTTDISNKPVGDLALLYYAATAQNNMLVLNAPPDRSGRVRELERSTLFQLRDKLGLGTGSGLPANVTVGATGSASAVSNNDVANYGPQRALDGNPYTRWASGPVGLTSATFEIDLCGAQTFDRILIDEYEAVAGTGRITGWRLQALQGNAWATIASGTACGRFSLHDFAVQTSAKVRLMIDSATDAPSIWELQLHYAGHGVNPVPAPAVINGSFEAGLAGWTASGNLTIKSTAPYTATDGTNLVAFNCAQAAPNGVLSQSFATVAGQACMVEFDAGVLAYNTYAQKMLVTVTGAGTLASKTITISGLGKGINRWLPQSLAFLTNSGSTTLTFRDQSTTSNSIDLLLDHVRVRPSNAVNSPPLALADSYTTQQDSTLFVPPAGVLANDSDPESGVLSAAKNTDPSHGSLSFHVDGSFSYEPVAGFAGVDSFTYHANDGALDSNIATVSITVSAPAAVSLVNGSFESGIAGWTGSGNVVVKTTAPYIATDGRNLVAFNSGQTTPNGVLSQSFGTVVGSSYALSFDSGVLAYNTNAQTMLVTVTGAACVLSKTITMKGLGKGLIRWVPQNFSFVADSSKVTLTFRDRSTTSNSIDLLLDKVKVSSMPAPSASVRIPPAQAAMDPVSGSAGTVVLTGTPGNISVGMIAERPGLYVLERSEDLTEWNWAGESWIEEPGPVRFLDSEPAPHGRMFYRIRIPVAEGNE